MKASVIVSTYNGAHKLPNVLQSLLDQTTRDFELIVAVDGSNDETGNVLDAWLPKFRDAKNIFLQHKGRPNVRNMGAEAASNELLFFVDDDMRLAYNCLEEHFKHHKNFPGSLVSGAQVYDERKARTDFQRYKCFISRNWCRNIEDFYPQPLPKEKLHLTAANFSVSKILFLQLGMFDETVSDMEDFLLAYKAVQQNIPVYYLHRALGWHDDFADIFAMQERYLQYKITAIEAGEKFPELPKAFPRYAAVHVSAWRKAAYWLLTKKWIIAAIHNNKAIPIKLRYRLYGNIIHAKDQLLENL